ncbi:alpha-N-acetylgalactosaminide alpha-2,6-sialyltransferase 2 isoform X1 [Hyperolius riggenbachi]|uniref:alpha-N-acetylgalactosaminide alpha-2,6-sialyltransferase 2 isoform X1 n=1 Tax=Hyperolius riggenbachi TaxID=752182 RepID=UPI0035A2B6F0
MRLRWVKLLCLVAVLAVSALFYGHYYTSVMSPGRHGIHTQDWLIRERIKFSDDSIQKPDGEFARNIWLDHINSSGVKRLKETNPAESQAEQDSIAEADNQATLLRTLEGKKVQELSSACPTSLRFRIQKDILFRKLFNFDVPVLMWDHHLKEKNSLMKRDSPYGWKNIPEQDVASTLILLNDTANQRLFDWKPPEGCVRCAVIGNGGILNGSRQGKEIDQHDYVFRLNGAVIKGFEEDVGTKTSFYGFTVNTMKNSLIAYYPYGFTETPKGEGLRYIFIPANDRDYIMLRSSILGVPVPSGKDKGDNPAMYFGPEATPKKFKVLHPDFLLYTRDTFLKSHFLNLEYGYLYMPSTGGLMLLTALHLCDEVNAYGFITSNYRHFSDHYYEREKKPLEFYANHDMILEMHLWRKLHESKIMNLYLR